MKLLIFNIFSHILRMYKLYNVYYIQGALKWEVDIEMRMAIKLLLSKYMSLQITILARFWRFNELIFSFTELDTILHQMWTVLPYSQTQLTYLQTNFVAWLLSPNGNSIELVQKNKM